MQYVSLHNHTVYSILDGLAHIDRLVGRAKELGMPALAITDHRNVSGHMEFYKECKKQGVKPILGVEINETNDRTLHSRNKRRECGQSSYHMVLLAKNAQGYKNLLEIVSDAATVGLFDKIEQSDFSVLAKHGAGLIATSACLAGRIPKLLLAGEYDEARWWATQFADFFDRFYIEVQPNGTPEQVLVNRRLVTLARDLGLPLLAASDTHYINPGDYDFHDTFICIQIKAQKANEERFRFSGGAVYYLWSPAEMERWAVSEGIPLEALKNSVKIAEEIEFELPMNLRAIPSFPVPDQRSSEQYLLDKCAQGLFELFGNLPPEEYRERLRTELDVICSKGFAGYFLILADILAFCRQQGIPYGDARGSAAGSLVAYLMKITKVDPIKHHLLFERFLNPERDSLPDIDTDISDLRRDEVIEYVRNKYGHDHVAQIATYGKLHIKSAVRDAMRVLGYTFQDADTLSKLIPEKFPDQSEVKLEKFLKCETNRAEMAEAWGEFTANRLAGQARKFREEVTKYPGVLDTVAAIEGAVRSAGIHAAGVLISPRRLTNYCALNASTDKLIASLDMDAVDDMGLLKMDLLGLRTVSVIQSAANMAGVNIDTVSLDDQEVFRLYQTGRTHGVFQMSGDGITEYAVKVTPKRFDDLVDILALYRPGPLDALMETGHTIADQYVYNRAHPYGIKYAHPDLEPIMSGTYGVMIYQEQVMSVCRKLTGYSLGGADTFRRIVGKKKIDEVEKLRHEFIHGGDQNPGGLALGYSEDLLQLTFDQIKAFAGYAFNRSHSCSYALLSYKTAWLKVHYPAEYMCALLSSEADDIDKTIRNVQECRDLGIKVLPCDLNSSNRDFQVEILPDNTKAIRYGLLGIKGIGETACRELLARREDAPYESLADLVKRTDGRAVHKKVMQILIKAGVFDALEPNRHKLLNEYLFNIRKFKETDKDKRHDEATWNDQVRLTMERELLGFYLTGHPTDDLPIARWQQKTPGQIFKVSGLVASVRVFNDKNQKTMATVELDTCVGPCKVFFFHKAYALYRSRIKPDKPMVVEVRKMDTRGGLEAIKAIDPDKVRLARKKELYEIFNPPVRRHPSELFMEFYS